MTHIAILVAPHSQILTSQIIMARIEYLILTDNNVVLE